MNHLEPVDPRPNTIIPEESSEILNDEIVKETVESEDGEKITITTMEVPTEEEISVANRDFSEDLKLYMAKYPAYQHMLGMEVPMRSYMWSFFSGIVNMHLCEDVLPYAKNSVFNKDADNMLQKAELMLASSKASLAMADKVGALDYLLLAAEYIAWAYLKCAAYEDKFVVPTPPEEKDVVEEIVEKELGE